MGVVDMFNFPFSVRLCISVASSLLIVRMLLDSPFPSHATTFVPLMFQRI